MLRDDKASTIDVQDSTLPKMMAKVEEGKWRIPQFQREFVWSKPKILELFDSIYQEFPIGSFFTWAAGREHNHLFRHLVGLGVNTVGEHEDVCFILDGQQRVTSLYAALHGLTLGGVDYSTIVFDLQEQRFKDRKPDNKRYVAVRSIWGAESMLLSRQIPEEYVAAYDRCWKILQTYPISIVEVREKQLPAVCKIFQRINQGGKRLDRFDLISAMTFTTDFDLRERFKADVLAPLKASGFGEIDPSIATQLLALVHSGQCTERYEFELRSDDIKRLWKSASDALLLAADTLRKNMGVATAEYLPYNAILTLLAYYFAKSGKKALSAEHMEWVRRWFWRAAFAQHYGGAAPTQMGRDRVLFDTLIGGGQPDFSPSMTFTAADFVGTRMTSSKSAIRNAFLCLLATRNPVNLENNGHLDLIGGGITDFTSNEKHHIFPQAYLKRAWPDNADVHAVPNFCFIPAELNKRISDSDPATYFPQLRDGNHDFEAAARTQLLPTATDAGVWDNDYPKFLAARAGLLVEEVQRLCGEITTPRQEERQAAVQRMEHRLRDRIQAVLMAAAGQGYWKMRIPSDVRETADGRIDDALRKHPDMESAAFENPRARLDYLNVMDYLTIIDSGLNWPQFESTFRSKQDLQNHLRAFSEYRNAVVNSRPMSELVRMAGETAMVWFGTVLPPNEAEEAEEENPPEGSESEPEGEEADE